MVYERLHGPLGPVRGDHQAAVISATVANAFRDKKGKAAKVSDFMPDWDKAAAEGGLGGDGP